MNLLTRCAAAGLTLLTALVLFEAIHIGASGDSVNTFDERPETGTLSDHTRAGQPSSVARPERRLLPASLPSQHIVLDATISDAPASSLAIGENRSILSTSSGNTIDTTSPSAADTSSLLATSPAIETDNRYTIAETPPAEIGLAAIEPPQNSTPAEESIEIPGDSSLVLSSPESSSTTGSSVLSEVGAPIAMNAAQNSMTQYPSTGAPQQYPLLDVPNQLMTEISLAQTDDQTDDPVNNLDNNDSTAAETVIEKPAPPIAALTPQMIALRNQIRTILARFQRPLLSTDSATVSDVAIGNLPYGCKTEVIRVDAGRQTRINGVTVLCWNYPCGGYRPLTISDGHISAKIGYGMQNTPGEMLGVFAFARVPADYPMRVGEDVRTVEDFVESEKLQCRSDTNQSMRLIGLVRYLGEEDPTWQNLQGEDWSIERLVTEELAQPVTTVGSEGPIRLLALAYTIAMRESRDQPITGEYARAVQYLNKYHDFALKLQNRDGSWSAAFLGGRGECRYDKTKLRTTGHILEWLSVSLPDAELYNPKVMQSAALLTSLLSASEYRSYLTNLSSRDISAVMHALHALAIYDNRAFAPFDPPAEEE